MKAVRTSETSIYSKETTRYCRRTRHREDLKSYKTLVCDLNWLLGYIVFHIILCEPGSSVSIVSGYGLDYLVNEVRSPAEEEGFFL
jgi:hypothetical protein